MRSQREFFHAVLSEVGLPCIASIRPTEPGQPKPKAIHTVYDSIGALCEGLEEIDFSSANYYFAISTLASKKVLAGKVPRVRVKENTKRCRVFILDIDIRDDKDGFATTKEEGYGCIDSICSALGLPRPIVVDSGYGLHVYWVMAEGIDTTEWTKAAQQFRSAVSIIAPAAVADASRVADCAGILRIPDSFNLKNGQQVPVEITQWFDGFLDFDTFKRRLDRLSPQAKNTDKKKPTLAATVIESPPQELAPVLKNCNWLREYAKNSKTASEPEWYAVLGAAHYLKHNNLDGRGVAHLLSKAHPEYDEAATDAKFDQARNAQTGPTLCSKFRDIKPERCNGCPFANSVSSPVHVGKLAREATKEVTVETKAKDDRGNVEEVKVTIPLPPKPYFRGEDGGVFVRAKNEEGEDVIEKIYDYDLYPVRRFRTEVIESELMEMHVWLPKDGLRIFKMPLSLLADNKKLAQFFAEKGVVPEAGRWPRITRYMVDYVRFLQDRSAAEVEFSRFGWRDINTANPKFVVGNGVIDKTGELIPASFAYFLKDAARSVAAQGDIAEWRKGFDAYKNIEGSEPYQFGILMGFAAPLLALTEYSGILYNLVGQTGAGKSTMLKIMSSVWGQPNPAQILRSDTEISMFNFLGYLNSVPIAFDELTHMESEQLAKFVLYFTGGRGKMRANREGENKQNNVEWDTVVVATSNTSVYDKISSFRKGYNAEAMRVYEVNVQDALAVNKAEMDHAVSLINHNYGLAGREFIKYILKNLPAVKAMVLEADKKITKNLNLSVEERFWGALFACVYVGGTIAAKLGLHGYDMANLIKWGGLTSVEARKVVKEHSGDCVSVIADFFNSNLDGLLKVNDNKVDLSERALTLRSVKARIEYEGGQAERAYIAISAIKKYCSDTRTDASWLRRELLTMGLLKESGVNKRLAAGTNIPGAPCKVWEIDMTNEKIRGLEIQDEVA